MPLPKKLFSLIPPPKVPPPVPKPAPKEISPVAFSSTVISITFTFSLEPSLILYLTEEKIFLAFRLFIDLLNKISLYGSPSSTIRTFLITSSKVKLFPIMLIC